MAESIGLIERAAERLRQHDVSDTRAPSRLSGEPVSPTGPQLALDRGRLASFGIAIPASGRSRTVEEFRLVKRNLMSTWPQSELNGDQRSNRLIMVTSARAGEGKTFSALNLAMAFASERDVKALLLDADTQHSTLPNILGIPRDRGIVDVLAGNLELSDVLIQTNLANLSRPSRNRTG